MATATTLQAARVALINTQATPATGVIPTAVNALGLSGRITYGWGWPNAVDDLAVLLMDARTVQEWRTSNRGRGETGEIEVVFLAHTSRGEQAAADLVFDMHEAVDRACRLGDGLGGVVEEIATGKTEYTVWSKQADRASGSFAYLLVTLNTRAIIRG